MTCRLPLPRDNVDATGPADRQAAVGIRGHVNVQRSSRSRLLGSNPQSKLCCRGMISILYLAVLLRQCVLEYDHDHQLELDFKLLLWTAVVWHCDHDCSRALERELR